MNANSKLTISTAIALLLPQIAMADISADDVWQNTVDIFATLGTTPQADISRSGSTVTIGETTIPFTLPFDAGELTITLSGYDMTEHADGSVQIMFPDTLTCRAHLALTDNDPVGATLVLGHEGLQMIATGTPDDITYTTTAASISPGLQDLLLPGEVPADSFTYSLTGSFNNLTDTTRVQVGNVIKITSSSTSAGGGITFLGSFAEPEEDAPIDIRYNAASGTTKGQFTVDLPRGGMDIVNLAAAVRDGLRLSGQMTQSDVETRQEISRAGEPLSDQSSTVGQQAATFSLDERGMRVEIPAVDITASATVPDFFPGPLEFSIAGVYYELAVPLFASDDMQDLVVDLAFRELVLPDTLWSMVDPEAQLPRDPMSLELDMTATGKNLIDWLDFAKVAMLEDRDEMPGEIHNLRIDNLLLTAAGAKVSGSGAASFDNNDLVSFNGLPKPTGKLALRIEGVNGLIDKLIDMGLVSAQDAMGARMMMTMFTQPDPSGVEDLLTSELEINEEGHILANGQRLQ